MIYMYKKCVHTYVPIYMDGENFSTCLASL
jgi:hypothetical protein